MQVHGMCIVGAGTMGTGIAQVAAQVDIRVWLCDKEEGALERSRAALDRSLRAAVEKEKLTGSQAEAVRARVSWHQGLAPVAEADWIVEAVFEDRQVKGAVLREIDALARPEAPVATNTSTIPIQELAADSGRPEYFLGMHFFNPPPAMKLVEIIPGQRTGPAVVAAAVALSERMGKTALVVPDIPGFVVNRVFGALVSAAADILAHGGSPEAIDTAVELGLGHKMGPLKTADLVGLDVMLAVLQSLHERTGHQRFEVPEALAELVAQGRLGKKTGSGFYEY